MTYQPKHRGEPVVKHRITVVERERGWGGDEWTEDFDTRAEAWARIQEINSKNTASVVPDYYISAIPKVTMVTL